MRISTGRKMRVSIFLLLLFYSRLSNGFQSLTARTLIKPKRPSTCLHAMPGIESSSMLETLSTSVAATNLPRAFSLGVVPAIGMAATTLVGLKIRTPPSVVGALQHFSAGILLTTVAKELLPEMVQAEGLAENLASGIGFFAGVGLLIGLGQVLKEDDDHNETKSETEEIADSFEEVPGSTTIESRQTYRLRNRRRSRQKEAFWLEGEGVGDVFDQEVAFFQAVDSSDATKTPAESSAEKTQLDEAIGEPSASTPLLQLVPAAFLTAIAVDAALDGLLIGISTATGDPSTGNILSASLLVESSFLGITIATALRGSKAPQTIQAGAALIGPLGTLTGSIIGGIIAPSLSAVGLAGLLGFGTSTILFMVAEELLLEAHEEGEEHVWWVDFQLYTGFFASVMVEKLVGA